MTTIEYFKDENGEWCSCEGWGDHYTVTTRTEVQNYSLSGRMFSRAKIDKSGRSGVPEYIPVGSRTNARSRPNRFAEALAITARVLKSMPK
ncbi:hypothetical protein F-M6_0123 [Faustovirus]|nr:hypothetical protein F-M6_0123 [Faustovirus]QJX72884.1 hypothetical protein F-VV57_0122 [Faustovirus]QJX73389.1 hypothetical protein F-VV63_0123 [Faustovirus]QJX73899.1 hypothetical protein F-E9_126 [Faustovirus]